LANLEKAIGTEIVKDVELRVMPPRVGPKREEAAAAMGGALDEAEDIADPGLRRIYKAARSREFA
jgi:hypothetical protein